MTEYGELIKQKADCQCGMESCTQYGTLGREDRNGKRHVRGCACPVCRGRRNRKGGLAKQSKAAKALGIQQGKFVASNEEAWDGYFDVEVKSGKQVAPVATAYLRCETQVLANRPDHGDRRKPVMVVAMPEGMSDGLVTIRLSAYREHIAPALTEFYGSGA